MQRIREELRLDEAFDRCFFSNEIGLRKPDPDCYRRVVEGLGVSAEEIVFFDDSRECVEWLALVLRGAGENPRLQPGQQAGEADPQQKAGSDEAQDI